MCDQFLELATGDKTGPALRLIVLGNEIMPMRGCVVVNIKNVIPLNSRNAVSGAEDRMGDDLHLFTRLPAPFVDMHAKGKLALRPLLQALFDNIDDALFELADRSEHNATQNMYFESMREIRIKRRGMEIGFAREIDHSFRSLLLEDNKLAALAGADADVSTEKLALVDDDEMEELVAADSMVAKAASKFTQPLKELTIRLDSLVEHQTVTAKNNPFGPYAICQAFIAVCHDLDLDIKAKLVLFKLFDRYVMSALDSVYNSCNKVLIDGGILPKLDKRRAAAKSPVQVASSASGMADSNQTGDVWGEGRSEEAFSDLQQLLHQLPSNTAPMGHVVSGLVAPGQAPQIPREKLLQLLQAVQSSLMAQMQQQQQAALQGVTPEHVDIQQSLSQLLVNKVPDKPLSIGQVDDDAINLVAMLFQFILDDRNLAAPLKALIARLQIPIIKIAMLDKTFFSKGGHPARKLLNEIANASLGWNPASNIDRDPFYNKVTEVVEYLLNEPGSDPAVFQHALADFVNFLEVDRRRTNLVEQRTVNAEDGKAKSELARNRVQEVLNEKVAGRSLPKVVISLLQDAWSNVLFLVYLKEGEAEGASNWQDALSVVDDLLWSVEPISDASSRQKLMKMVPGLLKNLRQGLTQIAYNPFDMNQLFADLEVIHLAQLKAKSEPAAHADPENTEPEKKIPQPRQIGRTLDQVLAERDVDNSSLAELDAELDQQLAKIDSDLLEGLGQAAAEPKKEEKVVSEQKNEARAQSLEQAAAVPAESQADNIAPVQAPSALERMVVDKLVVNGVSKTDESESEPELSEDDPSLKRVDGLAMGHWVEIHQSEDKKYRCRLAAVIRSSGKYIFVNRSGMKVAEHSRMSLAQAIKHGTITMLDEGLLFDRALESVIGNLRKAKA